MRQEVRPITLLASPPEASFPRSNSLPHSVNVSVKGSVQTDSCVTWATKSEGRIEGFLSRNALACAVVASNAATESLQTGTNAT